MKRSIIIVFTCWVFSLITFITQLKAADFEVNFASLPMSSGATVDPGIRSFQVNSIPDGFSCRWYVNNVLREIDNTSISDSNVKYDHTFLQCDGVITIQGRIYDSRNGEGNYVTSATWNVTIAKPDLIVSCNASSTNVNPGVDVTVNWTIRNQGTLVADFPSNQLSALHFYLSTNNTFGAGDILLETQNIADFAANEERSGNKTITIPSVTACGTYYIVLYVDFYDNIEECANEGNNTSFAQITVGTVSVPPTGISGPNSICSGQTISLCVTGGSLAGGAIWKWYYGNCGENYLGSGNCITVSPNSTSTYFVRAEGGICNISTPCRSLTVNVNSSPSLPGSITGSTSVCQGVTATYSIPPVSGATSYSWTLPSGWIGNSTSRFITATVGSTNGIVSVIANNPCGSSTASTLNVIVNQQVPTQPGTISGNTTVCNGVSTSYYISVVPGATSYMWTLPPGWSGSSTSSSITVIPGSNGGTISVRANNSCGSGIPGTVNVFVAAQPAQPGTISGAAIVCQGVSTIYNISAVPGATSYTWTLPSGWSGSSTSTSITATPGSNGGTISVRTNNSCSSSIPSTGNVSVTTLPAQPGIITGTTAVCQGSSQIYSISSVTGATSYTWTLPSGWSGSSASASITATPGSNGGTISVTANNTCGSSTPGIISVSVTAQPAQPGTITGNITVCQGVSTAYSISAVSGATSYTWALPSGWSGSSTSTSINTIPGSGGGTISVTANNTCGSGIPVTLSVSVSSTPAQPGAITGVSDVCQGSSQTYSISSVARATSYTWTLPSGWSGSSTSTSITVIPGSGGGTISVTASNTCGSSTPSTGILSVTSIPAQPGAITGTSAVCKGVSTTYSISAVSGATSYTWSLPSGWSGSSTSTSITAIPGSSGVNISVTANNTCGSSTPTSLSVSVTSIPDQPGAITGTTAVCQGSSQSYSISAVPGATSYTWTLPSGWIGSSASASITAIPGSGGGTISVIANNTCGSGTPTSLVVTVSSIPAQPGVITGASTVCQGSTQTYSISSVTGATSYTWTLPSGWSGSSASTSITTIPGSGGGTISVTANNFCGSSTPVTLSVSVISIPVQPGAITGASSVCMGSSQTYNISSVTGATSYTWSLPSGWSGSSTSASITATPGSNGGTISVTANNTCGSSTPTSLSISVSSIPDQPGAISGASTVCVGTSQTYSISSVARATSYTWSLPSGWSGNSTSTSITVTPGSSGGTISVTASNSCGSGTPSTGFLSVLSIPAQPGTITGTADICQGSSQIYSISAVSGATSYTWSLPSGWSGSSTSTSITAIPGSSGVTVSVTADNTCGSSAPGSKNVSVTALPAQPGTITGSTSLCQGVSNTFSISAVSGATFYTWTLPSGWSGSSTTTSITATPGSNGGTVSVTANNTCGSGTQSTLSVSVTSIPAQPGAITGTTAVCQGSSQTYSISSVAGATSYIWSLPSGWSGSSTSASITATPGSNGGTISVTATNTCGSGTQGTLSITVTSIPDQPGAITGSTAICQGSTQTYSISAVPGATSYTWTLPSGWSGSSTSTSITAIPGSGGGTISVTANNTCGSSAPVTKNVLVTALPAQPGTITGAATVCQESSQTYSISPVTGATSYIWSLPSGWSGSSTTTSINVTTGSSGGTISITANNSCGSGTPSSAIVKTGVVPKINVKWNDVLICSNLDDSIASFQWFKGSSSISGATNQFYETKKLAGIYKVETIDKNGCKNSSYPISISGTKSLSVYPNPTSSSFALKISDESEGRAVVSIMNSAGIKVMEFQAENMNDEILKEIPVKSLNKGIYVVQVLIDNKDLYFTKIVVVK
jgi:hypothetical protein